MPVIPILGARLPVAHAQSVDRDLAAVPRVDGDRPGHLLRVRPPGNVFARDAVSAASRVGVPDPRGSEVDLGRARLIRTRT